MAERWTLDEVPGQRPPDIPVYILTSRRSFSAAESFTLGLKGTGRAIVVGERTGRGKPGKWKASRRISR